MRVLAGFAAAARSAARPGGGSRLGEIEAMSPGLPNAMTPQGALFTGLYELRMAHAHLNLGMREEAVFTLAVRRLPAMRNDLLACGTDVSRVCWRLCASALVAAPRALGEAVPPCAVRLGAAGA